MTENPRDQGWGLWTEGCAAASPHKQRGTSRRASPGAVVLLGNRQGMGQPRGDLQMSKVRWRNAPSLPAHPPTLDWVGCVPGTSPPSARCSWQPWGLNRSRGTRGNKASGKSWGITGSLPWRVGTVRRCCTSLWGKYQTLTITVWDPRTSSWAEGVLGSPGIHWGKLGGIFLCCVYCNFNAQTCIFTPFGWWILWVKSQRISFKISIFFALWLLFFFFFFLILLKN